LFINLISLNKSSKKSEILDTSKKMIYICKMNIAKKVEKKINTIKEGNTFTYQDLAIKKDEYTATAKTLERLIKKEIIKRVTTGIFYKPKKTIFGELKPNEEEIIKPYLYKSGKRIAYITGTFLYNKMGLTPQIPKEIKIASREKRIYITKGNIRAKAVKSYIDVTDTNYKLLEFLDALKDFKKIPDLNKKSAIEILKNKLFEFNQKQINYLIKFALKYPPRVRAFLGALLEVLKIKTRVNYLQKSLNPLSEYALDISKEILKNVESWNIK